MLSTLLPALILMALVFIPTGFGLVAVLLQRRWEQCSDRRSPISEKLLHQAGAHARKKAEVLGDDMMERLMQLMLIGPMAMLVILLPRVQWNKLQFSWVSWLVVAGAASWAVWLVRTLVQLRKQRRKWQAGMRAEIAVAQQLDRLQLQGLQVLHDIPAGNFNLDHVVLGTSAVFMVETKSRQKPGTGKASAQVSYDGKGLQFPGWAETKPLEQARAQARWLSDYLRGETGEAVPVVPVVCLPGWYVNFAKDANRSDVKVINPKFMSLFTDAANRPTLDAAQRTRIVHALFKRYPELEA